MLGEVHPLDNSTLLGIQEHFQIMICVGKSDPIPSWPLKIVQLVGHVNIYIYHGRVVNPAGCITSWIIQKGISQPIALQCSDVYCVKFIMLKWDLIQDPNPKYQATRWIQNDLPSKCDLQLCNFNEASLEVKMSN